MYRIHLHTLHTFDSRLIKIFAKPSQVSWIIEATGRRQNTRDIKGAFVTSPVFVCPRLLPGHFAPALVHWRIVFFRDRTNQPRVSFSTLKIIQLVRSTNEQLRQNLDQLFYSFGRGLFN